MGLGTVLLNIVIIILMITVVIAAISLATTVYVSSTWDDPETSLMPCVAIVAGALVVIGAGIFIMYMINGR